MHVPVELRLPPDGQLDGDLVGVIEVDRVAGRYAAAFYVTHPLDLLPDFARFVAEIIRRHELGDYRDWQLVDGEPIYGVAVAEVRVPDYVPAGWG